MNKKINAVIIGAQKAGTTAVHNWLSQHPEINAPNFLKDFPFFLDDYFNISQKEFIEALNKEYNNEKIILHSYVNYLYFYNLSIERIKNYNKDIKILIFLRSPIERAISAFYQMRKVNYEKRQNIYEILDIKKEKSIINIKDQANLTYLLHGNYFNQIKAFYSNFDEHQIKLIIFEDLVQNKQFYFNEICKFLCVEANYEPLFTTENSKGLIKNKFFASLYTYSMPWIIRKIIPLKLRLSIRKNYLDFFSQKFFETNDLSDLRKKLHLYYESDIKKLENKFGLDLSIWSP